VTAPAVVFLHLSKTGGTTLRRIIQDQYGSAATRTLDDLPVDAALASLGALRPKDAGRVRAVIGHLPFGVQDHLPFPAATITLIRDPLDRVLSHYRYAREDPTAPAHAEVLEGGLDLAGYVRDATNAPFVANGQTRLLGGGLGHRGPPDAAALERAIARVDTDLAVAGVTERFEESVLMMRSAFGWDWPVYRRWKVSAEGPHREELPGELVAEIYERNALDRALHAHAIARLDARVAALGAPFQRELTLFRLLLDRAGADSGAR
jgi:hypothetical protein